MLFGEHVHDHVRPPRHADAVLDTVLEPVTGAMLAGLAEVSAHFRWFRVTEISLSQGSQRQFDLAPILDTVSVVVWKSLRLAGVDPAGWGRLFRGLSR